MPKILKFLPGHLVEEDFKIPYNDGAVDKSIQGR
jgi:hypothetical protein